MTLAIFDLDDTLVDRTAAFDAWARSFVASKRQDDETLAWIHTCDRGGREDRASFFVRICERYPSCGDPAELIERYEPELVERYVLDDDVREALGRLRTAGWRIGIATNGGPLQARKIASAGLDALVDGWRVSSLCGSAKPDRVIFDAVARACGCALDGGWMVGDDPGNDVAGGAAAGLRTVWVRRGRTWDLPGCVPTRIADGLPEAVGIILS